MSRYGQIHDFDQTASEFRVQLFIGDMDRIDFGNCGVPTALQEYFKNNREKIEDVFVVDASMYVLPATHESAKELFDICRGKRDEDEDDGWYTLADEISWVKLGDRYWLSLWWD